MKAPPRLGESRELVVCDEVTRTQIVQYAGASGDLSVLHTDEPAARAAGHPAVMAHGMMTMAASSRVITNWFGTGALRTLGVRFTAPVWPGDRLVSTATVEAMETVGALTLVQLVLQTVDQEGRVVLTGNAGVAIDVNSNGEWKMPDEHPHAVAVRRLMEAFSSQDRTAIEELLDPTCVWRVPGQNGIAGEYAGLPAVMGLFGTLKRVFTVPARFEVIDIATSSERVIVYQYGVAVVGTRTVRMKECLIYRFHDGRIVEVDEFQYDQAAFDEAFSRDAVATLRSP